ncbi:hypothetical protein [Maribacter sp. 2210JD10-5]|uniref:hypothetical protein n=1 Tax=Maribacter sp. 2210JD10-5 TaxID=3386272 RepID=UPI0039BC42A9
MELEELQKAWSQMSQELENQKKLTNNIIMKMTQEKYRNKFKTVSIFETVGAVFCFVTAIYIIINFSKLDTWYLMACGIFSLVFLLVLPVVVLRSIFKLKNMDIVNRPHKEALDEYLKEKNNLMLWQRITMGLSLIQLFSIAIVFAKLFSGKDFFLVERNGWNYVAMAFSVLLIIGMIVWAGKGYRKMTNSAENIINELE